MTLKQGYNDILICSKNFAHLYVDWLRPNFGSFRVCVEDLFAGDFIIDGDSMEDVIARGIDYFKSHSWRRVS